MEFLGEIGNLCHLIVNNEVKKIDYFFISKIDKSKGY